MKFRLFLITTVLGLAALAITSLLPSSIARAQSGQALEIAPPVVNLSAKPGETITTQISLRDVSDGPLIVTGQVNDFVAGGEDGTPKILMDATEPNPYSMRNWVAPLPALTLEPQQIEKLPVTIHVPPNAAPGGYYSVIRFTATPPELEGTGVSLSASLGALVLLTVEGEVKEEMAIEEFFVTKDGQTGPVFESTPITFVERIKNKGNIHEQPRGQVIITDMFGNVVAGVNVNMPPRNILPHSIRKFEQPLNEAVIGNKQLFGLYHAKLTMTYGEKQETVSAETSFWVIPYRLIGIGIAALIIGFFVLRFMLRRYNRRIISKAQKRR